MDLLHLVDRLEELAANSQKMPIGSRAIIDRRRLLDIVDQMRIAVPQDVRDAQEMVNDRERLTRDAEEEARIIVARAEEQAARLIDDHDIAAAARARAEEIALQAQGRLEERIAEANSDVQQRLADSRRLAEQQMSAADDYARELLSRLERQLEAFVRSARAGLAQLEPEPAPPEEEVAAVDEVAGELAAVGVAASDGSIAEAAASPPGDLPGSAGVPSGSAFASAEGEMENLLRRDPEPPSILQLEPEPDTIDDFALPPLDDDPTLRPQGEDAK